ncbi:MAG: CBS domain-containing protein [Chloroflexota bacterium]
MKLSDNQEEVARTIAKYNLMSIPVVDAANRLHGIVTVDDAVDILLPTAWKKRLPRIF